MHIRPSGVSRIACVYLHSCSAVVRDFWPGPWHWSILGRTLAWSIRSGAKRDLYKALTSLPMAFELERRALDEAAEAVRQAARLCDAALDSD